MRMLCLFPLMATCLAGCGIQKDGNGINASGDSVRLPPIRIGEDMAARWQAEIEHQTHSSPTQRFQIDVLAPDTEEVGGVIILQFLRPDGVTFQSFSRSFTNQDGENLITSTDVVLEPGSYRFKATVIANQKETLIEGNWNVIGYDE